jgi:hypothetical protein
MLVTTGARCLIVGTLTLASLSVATAQQHFGCPTIMPGTVQSQAPIFNLNCDDFRRNSNGSWSPIRPVQICPATTIGPDVSLDRGMGGIFCGVPVAGMLSILNRKCPP